MMTHVLYFRTPAYARSVVSGGMVTLILIFMCISRGMGQSTDEQQVKDVVAQLFKGMELGDSALVHRCFMSEVTLASLKTNKEGRTILSREGSIKDFYKAIGTPHPEKWYEESWNVRVSIDGMLAQVWCDYAFYVGNKFSHCGVDAFHLFKDDGKWKIVHLADTRSASGCNSPSDVAKKHAP